MDIKDLEELWNETPQKGLLPKGVKARMWENIEKQTYTKRRHRYRWIAAASIVIVTLIGSYLFLMQTEPLAKMIVTNTYPQDIRLLRLPDGSRVWVNQNTEISYPSEFTGSVREVTLSGEAFFEVARDPEKPFIITSGAVKTTVLGTSFNVEAYTGKAIEVKVRTGKVKVETSENTVMLEKGNAAIAPLTTGKLQKKIIPIKEPEWKKALIDIDGLTLQEVMQKIQVGNTTIQVIYTSEDLKKLKIKGTLDTRQGIAEMMQTVAFALGINISSADGSTFTISR